MTISPFLVYGWEPDSRAGTFADGSLGERIKSMIRKLEEEAFGMDLTRAGKPFASVCRRTHLLFGGQNVPHLHVGFRAVPVDAHTEPCS